MNLSKIIEALRRELRLIEQAIASLERLVVSGGRPRRGRPPAWIKTLKRRGRPRKKDARRNRLALNLGAAGA
jgi:hypothetical protein